MFRFGAVVFAVIPAKAGIQPLISICAFAKCADRLRQGKSNSWIPAFAGMTT
jgi:hypothetical protein